MSAFFAGLGADEDGVGDRGYCSGLRVGGLRVDEDEDSMASLLVWSARCLHNYLLCIHISSILEGMRSLWRDNNMHYRGGK